MSMAWETTTDDIENVLRNSGIKKTALEIEKIHTRLGLRSIERAALYGSYIEEQTDFAHAEIREQLVEMGIIPEKKSKKKK